MVVILNIYLSFSLSILLLWLVVILTIQTLQSQLNSFMQLQVDRKGQEKGGKTQICLTECQPGFSLFLVEIFIEY